MLIAHEMGSSDDWYNLSRGARIVAIAVFRAREYIAHAGELIAGDE